MKKAKAFLYIISAAIVLLFLQSCTRFSTTLPDGTVIECQTPPLIAKDDGFVIKHEWIDQYNVLHEISITRNVNIEPDAQVEALRIVRDLAIDAGAKGAR